MLITIEQRHTIGTEYQNCNDCALARALRERLPGSEILVGGLTVEIDGKVYEIDGRLYNQGTFNWLQSGFIPSLTIEIQGYHPTFVSVAQEAAERLADKRVNN